MKRVSISHKPRLLVLSGELKQGQCQLTGTCGLHHSKPKAEEEEELVCMHRYYVADIPTKEMRLCVQGHGCWAGPFCYANHGWLVVGDARKQVQIVLTGTWWEVD